MKLSPNFTLEELTGSDIAARLGRPMWPPTDQAPQPILANLTALAVHILEPVRAAVGDPIVISSGYRPPWLNGMVHGAKNSAHMYGLAADTNAQGLRPSEFAAAVHRAFTAGQLPGLDQCIVEFDRWVHLAIAASGVIPRGQFLTASAEPSGVVYRPWSNQGANP